MVNQYVDDIVTVSEDEIAAAILALLEKQKVIAEGAGAVSTAAVLFDKLPVRGKKVVSIGFRRKYRREYSQPGDHQRSRHQREKCQSDHRADGQAGAASGCVGKSSPPAEEMWLRCITTVRMRIWRSPAAI